MRRRTATVTRARVNFCCRFALCLHWKEWNSIKLNKFSLDVGKCGNKYTHTCTHFVAFTPSLDMVAGSCCYRQQSTKEWKSDRKMVTSMFFCRRHGGCVHSRLGKHEYVCARVCTILKYNHKIQYAWDRAIWKDLLHYIYYPVARVMFQRISLSFGPCVFFYFFHSFFFLLTLLLFDMHLLFSPFFLCVRFRFCFTFFLTRRTRIFLTVAVCFDVICVCSRAHFAHFASVCSHNFSFWCCPSSLVDNTVTVAECKQRVGNARRFHSFTGHHPITRARTYCSTWV